jgi:predicted nucleic acid binding AN1-type Zn finger protein
MAPCLFCRKRTHFNMICKWCDSNMCIRCIQTEVHGCSGLIKMKESHLESLKHKLINEKVVGVKLVKV